MSILLFIDFFSTQEGSTALLYAGWKGHSEVVKLLLGAGARDIPNKVKHVEKSPKSVLLSILMEFSPCLSL